MSFFVGLTTDPRFSIVRYFFAGVAVSLGYTFTIIILVEQLRWCGPAWASAISFLLWTPVSYFAHREFTFRFDHRHRAAATKYFVSFLLRLGASALVVVVAIDYLHLHYLVGVLMNWIVLPLINYFVLRFWVFAVPQLDDVKIHALEAPRPAIDRSGRIRHHADCG
jgi:putative flippase GtrA